MAIRFLNGQTVDGALTVSGNVQGATFNGLAINTSLTNNVANQIVRTQGNGYANFGWINSISGNHTGTITRITASNDQYLRYVTPAQFRTGVTDGYYAPVSTVSGVTSVSAGNGLAASTNPIISTGTLSTVHLPSFDTRNSNPDPEDYANIIRFDFKTNSTNGLSDGGTYNGQMTWRSYGGGSDLSGGQPIRLAYTANGNLWRQMGTGATSWGSWAKFALETSGGFLPLSGGTLTGALSGTSATFSGTLAAGATTLTSATQPLLLTLNSTANGYGGILFQYGGVTKGLSYYNSGMMIFGGEAGIPTRLQAGGQYGLHIDATNQNVHIGGYSNVTYKLQVTGTTLISGGLKVIGPGSYNTFQSGNDYTLGLNDSNSVSQWWLKAYTTGDFALHENAVGDQFTIKAGGNVGIGTTSPDNKLTVKAANCIIDAQSTADSQTIGFRAGYLNHGTLAGFFRYTTGDAQLYIDNEFVGNNAVYSDINFRNKTTGGVLTNRIKIKGSTGNVGIGTDSPTAKLDVNGTIRISTSGRVEGRSYPYTTNLGSGADATTTYLIAGSTAPSVTSIDLAGGTAAANPKTIIFKTASTQRMRILANGNVVIGTETSTACTLKVSSTKNGSESDPHFCITGNGYTALHFLNTTAYYIVQNSSGRSIRIVSNTNGVKLDPGATAWTSNSDIALKENIKPLENVLDKIKDYRCVEYNLKNSPEDKKIGFIAQDWVEDFPAIVDKDEKDMLGMKYTETIPVLLKAIQEQQKQIEDLQAQIKNLSNL